MNVSDINESDINQLQLITTGDKVHCFMHFSDINECLTFCSMNALCTNTPGSFYVNVKLDIVEMASRAQVATHHCVIQI